MYAETIYSLNITAWDVLPSDDIERCRLIESYTR